MTITAEELLELYKDPEACAALLSLRYISPDDKGIARKRAGMGFSYWAADGTTVDAGRRSAIQSLGIPPAWQNVWICPDDSGHVLATGVDEKGRKQYIYNPKWRSMRDLIKFYRMILFGKALPKIRRTIDADLARPELDRDKVIGVMLWLLDNTYLRIGNDTYFTENDSVGLTTLSDKNLVVAGPVITLSFRGKSGKDQHVTFENEQVAGIILQLVKQRGDRLFRYPTGTSHVAIESIHINSYLHEITGIDISAKDFRTWGGTLMAFNHLVEIQKQKEENQPKPAKVVIEAVDAAANVLGNTRSVAKSSYIHPDILTVYSEQDFGRYYDLVRHKSPQKGLDKRESELVGVLEQLFDTEFSLLQSRQKT
jgi:DNA topoisomerase-1